MGIIDSDNLSYSGVGIANEFSSRYQRIQRFSGEEQSSTTAFQSLEGRSVH